MIKLMVLGPNFNGRLVADAKYRGLDRIDSPTVEMPQDIIKAENINKAFEKYMNNSDFSKKDGEYLESFSVAQEIASVYTLNNEKGDIYEVIEVTSSGEAPQVCKLFLGYDVVYGHSSAILDFFCSDAAKSSKEIQKYRSSLNENFLFSEIEIAKDFCLDAGKILGDPISLEVAGIYTRPTDATI